MTETPESSTEPTTATPEVVPPPRHDYTDHRPTRLYQVLAWVGIIAGVVFIVAVIFFSGVFFGRASGGYHGWASRLPRRPDGAGRLDGRLPDDAARRNDGTPLE